MLKLFGLIGAAVKRTVLRAATTIFNAAGQRALSDIDFILVLMGKAFGPDGAIHFSELPPALQTGLLNRVPVLSTHHTDWPAPLNVIPRTSTTWLMLNGQPPPIIAGNTSDRKPIPDRGTWFVSRGYMAYQSPEGFYIRCGFRWDDVDLYLTFPAFTVKHFK